MNLIEKIKNYQGIRTDILFITLQSVIVEENSLERQW